MQVIVAFYRLQPYLRARASRRVQKWAELSTTLMTASLALVRLSIGDSGSGLQLLSVAVHRLHNSLVRLFEFFIVRFCQKI